MLTFKGNIKLIYDLNQVSEKFKKQEFVVTEVGSPYPQEVLFQTTQEKTDLLRGLKAGDEVEVSFNLRGRAWTSPKDNTTKYFNSLDAWKIAKTSAQQPSNNNSSNNVVNEDNFVPQVEGIDDDLPF